jgi:hypothetical protein
MSACKGVEDPLTRLHEQPDEPGEGFERLLAVVEGLMVGSTPEARSGAGEGEVVVLKVDGVEADFVDSTELNDKVGLEVVEKPLVSATPAPP